jgi:hypothetical protein
MANHPHLLRRRRVSSRRRGAPTPPLTPQALKAAYRKSARDGLDGWHDVNDVIAELVAATLA